MPAPSCVLDPHFTDMDPDPVEHRPADLSRERPKSSLDQERELHRVRRLGKDDEEGVAGGFNLFAFAELAEDFPNRRVVTLDRRDRLRGLQALLELGRVDNVGEQQSQQPTRCLR